ncbi:MAG: sulfatase family protein, partial [Aureliella sp.]
MKTVLFLAALCMTPLTWLVAADGEPDNAKRANAKRANAKRANAKRPNVVFILTDNQGAWTLGCYGNPDIHTPNIDKLAQRGMRFTRALSSNPVCSPTRATFLTGLIPSQHGVHSFLDPQFMRGPKAYNTLAEFQSLGEVLQQNGYTCGLSGKWHLGDNLHPSEGFTAAWTTKPDGHTVEFYDQQVIEDGKVRIESGYTTDLWTRKGVEFIEQNQDRPFFLYLAYNGPYSLGG